MNWKLVAIIVVVVIVIVVVMYKKNTQSTITMCTGCDTVGRVCINGQCVKNNSWYVENGVSKSWSYGSEYYAGSSDNKVTIPTAYNVSGKNVTVAVGPTSGVLTLADGTLSNPNCATLTTLTPNVNACSVQTENPDKYNLWQDITSPTYMPISAVVNGQSTTVFLRAPTKTFNGQLGIVKTITGESFKAGTTISIPSVQTGSYVV